jgi:hypothetical protein
MGQDDPRYHRITGNFRASKGLSAQDQDMVDRYEWRGVLRAYVSQDGARHQSYEGTMAYHDMFIRAPKAARFVIVEEDRQRFIVFDMWHTQEVKEEAITVFIRPKKFKVYHDLDHAIGATVMQYNDTSLLSRVMTPLIVTKVTAIIKEWLR